MSLGTAQVTHAESTEHQKILRSPGRWITDVRMFSSQYCWWQPEIWRFKTSWGNGSLPLIIYRVSKTSILGGCSFYHPKNTWSWKTLTKKGITPLKTNMTGIFNRKYIFIHGGFSIVMLVFGGLLSVALQLHFIVKTSALKLGESISQLEIASRWQNKKLYMDQYRSYVYIYIYVM